MSSVPFGVLSSFNSHQESETWYEGWASMSHKSDLDNETISPGEANRLNKNIVITYLFSCPLHLILAELPHKIFFLLSFSSISIPPVIASGLMVSNAIYMLTTNHVYIFSLDHFWDLSSHIELSI